MSGPKNEQVVYVPNENCRNRSGEAFFQNYFLANLQDILKFQIIEILVKS